MPAATPPVPGRLARNPARVVALVFLVAIAVGTLLLWLPVSADGPRTTPMQALFTAVSAVCVTGLTVVDTGSHWSATGEVIVLVLVKVGGLGIMTLASVVVLALNRRLGVQTKHLANAERTALSNGEIRPLLVAVVRYSFVFEAVGALLLFVGFRFAHDRAWTTDAWSGVFHSVMAFNNAGFGLRADSLSAYVGNWWINGVIAALVICGGIGFPVLLELRRRLATPRGTRRPSLTLHTRITLITTGVLLVLGTVVIVTAEWTDDRTLGAMSIPEKLLAAGFQSVQTRTAGFNSIDIGAMDTVSWLFMSMLMFVGGGSAGTAGGIKVTTFAVIALMIWSEVRGDADVHAHRRRLPERTQRRAVAIAAISMGAVVAGSLAIKSLSTTDLDRSLFEATSAFGTVGLSTGITASLPEPAQAVLVVLMYLGRLGPLTLGAALVLRERHLRFRYPEEQPILG
ncbi:MAG: TrkH family potassium uptake protein [Actinobacteria bacterium]|nr:TrkH family potassium uptake protein [Actinomycetota bacterium]